MWLEEIFFKIFFISLPFRISSFILLFFLGVVMKCGPGLPPTWEEILVNNSFY